MNNIDSTFKEHINTMINKNIGITASVIGLVAAAAVAPASALADQYGGGPNASISLNKMVQDPSNGNFVDNLGVNDHRFQGGEEVTYRLVITNNGSTNFGFVDVIDTLPSYLDFVSGPGEFNKDAKQVKFRLENFTPGKTETRDIKARVVPQNQLPRDRGVFCVVNTVSLRTHDDRTASDTAQICIGNQVLGAKTPIKELPATGYPEYLFSAMFLGLIGTGVALRKARY